MSEGIAPARPAARGANAKLVDGVWQLLTSIKLAIILILAIAAGALIGASIMQAPPPALVNQEQFSLWVEQARGKYGIWTDLFARLQFFDVFGSVWFRMLVLLLAANVLVCTIHRLPRQWRAARRLSPVRMPDSMFERAPLHASWAETESVAAAASRVRGALHRQRYSVRIEQDGATTHLFAEKNRYGPLGTFVTHTGIIVVLLGVVLGGVGGFTESQFVVTEGSSRPIGHGTGMTVQLVSFMDEYYTGGGGIPKDYRSEVVVYRDGEQVAAGTIRVNEPLGVRGVRIHQAYYGPAIVMKVRDAKGQLLHYAPVPLLWSVFDRPAGSFTLPGTALEVFVIGSASAFLDDVVLPGQVRLEVYQLGGTQPVALQNLAQGAPTRLGDLEYTFEREARFSGLQVVKDPALPAIWIGAAMLVVGSVAVLYFPRRRVWARLSTGEGGESQMALAAPRERGLPFDREFNGLRRQLGAEPARAAEPHGEGKQ